MEADLAGRGSHRHRNRVAHIPLRAGAARRRLPFENNFFDAIISIDALIVTG